MGQTPIYDWLRGERINADVPPSRVDQHGHSGRHCLDEHMLGAVAVVVRPSGPAADGLTGHLRRGWIYADARRAGEELGVGWARAAPGATIASEAPARATPPQAGHPSADAADDLLAVPATVVGDKAGGHRAVAAARPEEGTTPCPAAEREAVFSWFRP